MSMWRTIPGFAGYAINDEGDCVSPLGNEITRVGYKKDRYNLTKKDGTHYNVAISKLLEAAMKRGRVVPDPVGREVPMEDTPLPEPVKESSHAPVEETAPVEKPAPDGCVPIPGLFPYRIDRRGNIWNSDKKAFLKWRSKDRSTPRVLLRHKDYSVSGLLDMTFGYGAAEDAGLPLPRQYRRRDETWGDSDLYAPEYSKELRPSRRCHDCKTPTNDYRCPQCLKKWRARNGVAENGGGEETSFDVLYI